MSIPLHVSRRLERKVRAPRSVSHARKSIFLQRSACEIQNFILLEFAPSLLIIREIQVMTEESGENSDVFTFMPL